MTEVPVEVSTIAFPPPSGVNVVVYSVITEPPFEVGAVNEIFALVVDVATAAEMDGAVGGAAGVVIVDPAEVVAPSPTALVALDVIEY